MKAKIDLEKFICSLMGREAKVSWRIATEDLRLALQDQGLECWNGEIVEIPQESEDEKIKKAIHSYLDWLDGRNKDYQPKGDYSIRDMIAWLENQGQQSKKVSIWKHWKDGIAGNGDGRQIYLTRQNGIYNVSSCLGCECDYIELSELDNLLLEKQGEKKSADKAESKFKVGDWIIFAENHNSVYQVERIDNYRYYLRHYLGGTLSVHFDNELIRPWSIKDAKVGDVLVHNGCTFIFMGVKAGIVQALQENIVDVKNPAYFGEPDKDNDYQPATKEQRDALEKAIINAGYRWDKTEKIKAEIERRKSLADKQKDNTYFFARSDAYAELLNFIDSLEEEPDCIYIKPLWHDAQGDELPPIDKEVVVLCDDNHGGYKVCFGHRPDPKGWIGKPISYGKGGWNIPNVRWWLDCNLPNMEEQQ